MFQVLSCISCTLVFHVKCAACNILVYGAQWRFSKVLNYWEEDSSTRLFLRQWGAQAGPGGGLACDMRGDA